MFPSSTPGSPPEASLEADVVHLAQEVRSEVQEAGVGVSRTPDGQSQRSQKVRARNLRQGDNLTSESPLVNFGDG